MPRRKKIAAYLRVRAVGHAKAVIVKVYRLLPGTVTPGTTTYPGSDQ